MSEVDAILVGLFCSWYGFRPAPARVLLALYRSRTPLAPARIATQVGVSERSVKVYICYIREALSLRHRDDGVPYTTAHAAEYQITQQSRDEIAWLIERGLQLLAAEVHERAAA